MTLNERIAKVKGFMVAESGRAYDRKRARWLDWSGSIADAWGLVDEMRTIGAPNWKQFTDALEAEVDRLEPEDPDVGLFRSPVCDLMWFIDADMISRAYLAVMEGK